MVIGRCKLKVRARLEICTTFFSATIFISVLLGLMDFSDIVILCRGQIIVASKTLSVLICLVILKVVFVKK